MIFSDSEILKKSEKIDGSWIMLNLMKEHCFSLNNTRFIIVISSAILVGDIYKRNVRFIFKF